MLHRHESPDDQRYCYGANCTWNGPIQVVGNTQTHPAHQKHHEIEGVHRHNLPCCPLCGGMLFQYESKQQWDEGMASFDASHPGYAAMWVWQQRENRCFKSVYNLAEAYKLATGIEVKL